MTRLVGSRLLAAVPVLFGITLLTFFVLDVLPGNAARQLLGADATPEQVSRLENSLHLNRPLSVRYMEWVRNAASGDLGRSLASNQPVTELLAERLPVTAELVSYALALALALAIPAALLAAQASQRLVDRVLLITSMAGLAVANYVLAIVLVMVFAVKMGWFPSLGFQPLTAGPVANLRSLTLPAAAIALPLFCFYMRFLRGDLLEQMSEQDYIVTAFAKGLGRGRVLVRHALRNSLLGLLTLVGLNLGSLFGGTVIIEQIFALPGVGQLLLQAITTRDVAVVQGLVLFLATMTVGAHLLVDVLYGMLDPRIRHGAA